MAGSKRSEAWVDIASNDFDSAFHLLLGRLVHAVARLDFSVGLQIQYWSHKGDTRTRKLLKPGTSKLHERLGALAKLIESAWSASHKEGQKELREWFENANKARGLRNEYAHGRWGVPGKHRFTVSGRLCDATPLLVFVPLHWDMSENRVDNTVELTLEEFAEQVGEAERLAASFWEIVSKYGQYLAVPPKGP